jgi:hypothetical protein
MEIRWPKAIVSSTRTRGAARAAGSGREGGRGGLRLTGGVCFPAARSRVVGGVAERAGGAFFFSLASGSTVLFTASGGRAWSGGVRASWHGEGKVRAT